MIGCFLGGERGHGPSIGSRTRNQHTNSHPNNNTYAHSVIELLLHISTMQRASAKRITAVIPYFGYARQVRKTNAAVAFSL